MAAQSTKEGSPVDRRFTVLMVTSGFFPKIGGTERQAEQLALAIQAAGVAVRVVTLRFRSDLPIREERAGLSIERIVYPRVKILGMVVILAKFARFLIRERAAYDVIHVHMVEYLASVAGVVGAFLRKPVILKFALRPSDSEGVFGDFPKIVSKSRILSRLLLSGIRRADRFVAVSQAIVEMAVRQGLPQDRVVLIPNGVNTQEFLPTPPDRRKEIRSALGLGDGPVVVYSGRLVAQKGVEDLLDAWRLVRDRFPTAKLHVIGEGRSASALRMRANGLGQGQSVVFHGAVDRVLDYLQASDVYVLPSRYEGMSNSLLEAMACSLPIVSTIVSGTVDLIRHGQSGLLVPPGEPTRLAEAIIQLLSDPEKAASLGAAARRSVEDSFTIQFVASRYLDLYRELTGVRAVSSRSEP